MSKEKKYAIVIDAKSGPSITEVDKFKIDFFTHDVVEGWFEALTVKDFGGSKNLILLVNEEGRLEGSPLNLWATMIFRAREFVGDVYLFGNAVLLRQAGTELEPFTKEEATELVITFKRGLGHGQS